MTKGEDTRAAIVGRALALTSQYGFEGLSIGGLAEDVGMSKSGLFAHFKSKQDLQLQVLEAAVEQFNRQVIAGALQKPRGVPRLRAFLEEWFAWSRSTCLPGGCVFMSLASEQDDRPGPLRDKLREFQRTWIGGLARAAAIAVEEGQLRADLDVEQFAYDYFSIFLGYHHFSRLMRDGAAEERALRSLDQLLTASAA